MIKIKDLKKDELIVGSFVLFIMMNIFNFFNYLFHFSMARMLGPADYGILAVLMSIVYIFAIPSESIQTVITGYTSRFNVKKEYGKIKDLLYKSLKKGTLFALIAFIIFIPVSFFLSDFLKIDFWLLVLTGVLIFYSIIFPILRGILQGKKKFKQLGFNMDIESVTKVTLAVILVLIGLKVYGAITSIITGGVIAFALIFLHLKEILYSKRKKGDFKEIYSYSFPIFIATVAIVLMYSLDIIIAKRFFSPEIAGQYAVISMLGKIIVFGTYSIGKTMFPLTSESHEKGGKTKSIFKKSMIITLFLVGAALTVYLIFPKLVITILFGAAYTGVSNILFIVGLGFGLISLSNIIILYKLSIRKMNKSSFILLVFVILQIILLSIFNSNLKEFSYAFLVASSLMFIYSLFLIKINQNEGKGEHNNSSLQ